MVLSPHRLKHFIQLRNHRRQVGGRIQEGDGVGVGAGVGDARPVKNSDRPPTDAAPDKSESGAARDIASKESCSHLDATGTTPPDPPAYSANGDE